MKSPLFSRLFLPGLLVLSMLAVGPQSALGQVPASDRHDLLSLLGWIQLNSQRDSKMVGPTLPGGAPSAGNANVPPSKLLTVRPTFVGPALPGGGSGGGNASLTPGKVLTVQPTPVGPALQGVGLPPAFFVSTGPPPRPWTSPTRPWTMPTPP